MIPLHNDAGKYNTETLSAMLDFKDYRVIEENTQDDNYCLAAPSASIHEIAQAAYPGTYDGKAAIGAFPRDLQLQNSFRKRIEVVYASRDAFERCEANYSRTTRWKALRFAALKMAKTHTARFYRSLVKSLTLIAKCARRW